jgi:hypothetical protein
LTAASLRTCSADPAAAASRYLGQGRTLGRPSLLAAEAFVTESGEITATRVGGRSG